MPRKKLTIQLVGECPMGELPDPVWPEGVGEIYLPWLENWSLLKSEARNTREQEMATLLATLRLGTEGGGGGDARSMLSGSTSRSHSPQRPASPHPPPKHTKAPKAAAKRNAVPSPRRASPSRPSPRQAASPAPPPVAPRAASPPRQRQHARQPTPSRSRSPPPRRSRRVSRSPPPRRSRRVSRSPTPRRSPSPAPAPVRRSTASSRRRSGTGGSRSKSKSAPAVHRSRTRSSASARADRRDRDRKRPRRDDNTEEDTDAEEDRLQYQADVLSQACPRGTIPADFADLPLSRKRRIVTRGRDRLTHARSVSIYRMILCVSLVGMDVLLTRLAKVPKGLIDYHTPFMQSYTSLLVDIDKQTGGSAGRLPPLLYLLGLVLLNTCLYAVLSAFFPAALPTAQSMLLRMAPDAEIGPPPAQQHDRDPPPPRYHRF